MKLKRKLQGAAGFTLVELMAVLLILGIIAIIAVPTINTIMKDSEDNAKKTSMAMIEKAAEVAHAKYISKNPLEAPEQQRYSVKWLVDNGYLDYDYSQPDALNGLVYERENGALKYSNRNLMRFSGGNVLRNQSYTVSVSEVDGRMAAKIGKHNNILYLGAWSQVLDPNYRFKVGEEYTFSYWAKASAPMKSDGRFVSYLGSDYDAFNHEYGPEWQRYEIHFRPSFERPTSSGIHLYPQYKRADGTYIDFYITDWQMEEGSVASSWMYAPEDQIE